MANQQFTYWPRIVNANPEAARSHKGSKKLRGMIYTIQIHLQLMNDFRDHASENPMLCGGLPL